MTAVKYANKFTKMSHFVEALVSTEKLKLGKFINGLQADIKKVVRLNEPTTYVAALKKAFVSEETN